MRGTLVSLAAAAAAALLTAAVLVTGTAGPAGAAAVTTVRLDGVGPLRIGMTQTAAVKTGWLAHRGSGCELAGPPLPVVYRLDGEGAPKALRGTAQFERGRLTVLTFTKGARTALGVTVGTTTTTQMAARYRQAGFAAKVSRENVFDATFVRVTKKAKPVIAGIATGASTKVTTLGVPFVPTCE